MDNTKVIAVGLGMCGVLFWLGMRANEWLKQQAKNRPTYIWKDSERTKLVLAVDTERPVWKDGELKWVIVQEIIDESEPSLHEYDNAVFQAHWDAFAKNPVVMRRLYNEWKPRELM